MSNLKTIIPTRTALLAAICISLLSGCVVQRGIDFGHWAQTGPTVPLVRFAAPAQPPPATPIRQAALLPILGDIDRQYLQMLDDYFLEEGKLAFRVPLLSIDRHGSMAQYATLDNLLPMGGDVWNNREIARMGQLLGVSHVICGRLRYWRQHDPQQLAMDFIVVETTLGATITEMLAIFDAREQQVVLAMDQYLRNRSARKYNRQSLEIIMRSPSEYSRFVAAQCMGAVAEKLWQPTRPFKMRGAPTDDIGGR